MVQLVPWSAADFWLLERCNSPEMTAYLGGPESAEQLAKRHHRSLHAYPGVDNAASNALCRKAGFIFQEARDFEYPKGHWMRCNDWALELQ